MQIPARVLPAIALLLCPACQADPVTPDPRPPAGPEIPDPAGGAIIYGQVLTSAGESVALVDVKVVVREGGSCDGAERTTWPAVTTDADGRYRGRFAPLQNGAFEGCVEVHVRPAAGSGLGPHAVRGGIVRFAPGPPFDSLRVDVMY